MNNKKVILISLANTTYLDFLEGCVRSFLYYYKDIDAKFEIYLVNPSKDKILHFKNISEKVNVNVLNIDFKKEQVNERMFCGNYRNYLLKKYSNENAILVWIDADSLFLRRSKKWLDNVYADNYDIIAYKGKKTILSGIIVCNTTLKAKRFIENYYKSYNPFLNKKGNKIKGSLWMMDQNKYKNTLKKMQKNGLRIKKIKEPIYASKIKDKKTIKKTHIWLPIREKKLKIYKDKLNFYMRGN